MVNLEYWNAEYTAPSRADTFLKHTSLAADDTDGNVEAPMGWFCYMDINRDDVAAYVSRFGDPWLSEARNFQPGWYAIVEDNNGLVFGFFYGVSSDLKAGEKAREDFETARKAYVAWDRAVDLNDGEAVMLGNNLSEIMAEARALRTCIDQREPVDTGDDSLAWNVVGTIAGDLANVVQMLWPDGDGPIE